MSVQLASALIRLAFAIRVGIKANFNAIVRDSGDKIGPKFASGDPERAARKAVVVRGT
jgi:hypothetical protein